MSDRLKPLLFTLINALLYAAGPRQIKGREILELYQLGVKSEGLFLV